MCSLQEHSARSAREHEAQTQEPIYATLAAEYGIQWEPPKWPLVQKFGPIPTDYQPHGHTG